MILLESNPSGELSFEEIHAAGVSDPHGTGAAKDLSLPAAGSQLLRRDICL
jgi:hypothetical protein